MTDGFLAAWCDQCAELVKLPHEHLGPLTFNVEPATCEHGYKPERCPDCRAIRIASHITIDLENGSGDPELTADACPAYLMEAAWEDGFRCVLRLEHDGPHVCRSWAQESCEGTDIEGRRYQWAHAWEWVR